MYPRNESVTGTPHSSAFQLSLRHAHAREDPLAVRSFAGSGLHCLPHVSARSIDPANQADSVSLLLPAALLHLPPANLTAFRQYLPAALRREVDRQACLRGGWGCGWGRCA